MDRYQRPCIPMLPALHQDAYTRLTARLSSRSTSCVAVVVVVGQRYQETLLVLLKEGITENALAEALETYLPDFQAQLDAYIAAVVFWEAM